MLRTEREPCLVAKTATTVAVDVCEPFQTYSAVRHDRTVAIDLLMPVKFPAFHIIFCVWPAKLESTSQGLL